MTTTETSKNTTQKAREGLRATCRCSWKKASEIVEVVVVDVVGTVTEDTRAEGDSEETEVASEVIEEATAEIENIAAEEEASEEVSEEDVMTEEKSQVTLVNV